MIDESQISEFDVFNYVFHPDKISNEKYDVISHSSGFNSLIGFFSQLKEDLKMELTVEQKQKITEKISVYKFPVIVYLFPADEVPTKKRSDVPILAAASAEKEPAVKAQTFIDDDRGFVIRLVRIREKTKIYLFPVNKEWEKKISLTLQPSNKKYQITDINTPLELENLETVEAISLDIE